MIIFKTTRFTTVRGYKEAIKFYDKAVEIKPNDFIAMNSKGIALY